MLKIRLLVVAAVTGMTFLVSGQASAGTLVANKTLSVWSNPATNTLDPGGDKIFTYISHSGFSGSTPVDASWNDNLTAGDLLDDTYSLALTGGTISSLTAGTYTLRYSIQIMSASYYYQTAALDSTHAVDDTSLTKSIYSDALYTNSIVTPLVSVNGTVIPARTFFSPFQTIYVEDVLVITGAGQLSGFSNNYTQRDTLFPVAAVPEPSSLVLLGLGGLGMVYRLRRRAK